MDGDRRLRWVQRNRGAGKVTVEAGALMRRLLQGLSTGVVSCPDVLMAVVAESVDAEFRNHCRLAMGPGRTLRVNVDRPEFLAVMRRRWSAQLRRKLGEPRGRSAVGDIRFLVGVSGRSIPEPRPSGQSNLTEPTRGAPSQVPGPDTAVPNE
ncbi:MAG: hypothetical protein IIB57_08990 [Planctomycetes bacterium]|nr:hypothetical protein [Planctomycetota bacterium]